MHALVKVHEYTLEKLGELDLRFTNQWVGANVGNTTTASLGIASAVLLFVAPPVGIGLGIGSAVTGGLSFAGDSFADRMHCLDFRRRVSVDALNSVAVSELVEQWFQAQRSLGASVGSVGLASSTGANCATHDPVAEALVDGSLVVGSVSQGGATTAIRTIGTASGAAAPGIVIASQVLGIAGALISTGAAIRGWSTMKAGQSVVRSKILELKLGILRIQHLLAAIDRLECPLCAEAVTLADDVRRCTVRMHCFHATCIQKATKGVSGPCHVCGGSLAPGAEAMVESLESWTTRFDQVAERGNDNSGGDVSV